MARSQSDAYRTRRRCVGRAGGDGGDDSSSPRSAALHVEHLHGLRPAMKPLWLAPQYSSATWLDSELNMAVQGHDQGAFRARSRVRVCALENI